MPTLSFFPWMTLSEPLRAGRFQLIPCGTAIASGAIPADLHEAVAAVLVPYGKTRRVDRLSVPLLRHDGVGIVDDPDEELVARYFRIRGGTVAVQPHSARPFSHGVRRGAGVRRVTVIAETRGGQGKKTLVAA